MENLFKKIGFDNFLDMLASAKEQKCLSEDLFFFRTILKAGDPVNTTDRNIHILFSVIRPAGMDEYSFQNIFARKEKMQGGQKDPIIVVDYWPSVRDKPPNKKRIIEDLKNKAQLDLVRKRFRIGPLTNTSPLKKR